MEFLSLRLGRRNKNGVVGEETKRTEFDRHERDSWAEGLGELEALALQLAVDLEPFAVSAQHLSLLGRERCR